METLIILSFVLLFANISWSQEKSIKTTNLTSQKEVIIKENKRIKNQSVDGNKISEPFKLENKLILIGSEKVYLKDIQTLERNPLLISIYSSKVLNYGSIITTGLGVLIGALVDPTAFLLIIPASAMIYAGIQSPNISKNYIRDRNWNFEIITLSETTISQ